MNDIRNQLISKLYNSNSYCKINIPDFNISKE